MLVRKVCQSNCWKSFNRSILYLVIQVDTYSYNICNYIIPANFFSVKYTRFFVFTEIEFLKIYRRLPKIAEVSGKLPKIAETFWAFRRVLKISQRLPKIAEGVERFSSTFQTNHKHCSEDVLTTSPTFLSNYTC